MSETLVTILLVSYKHVNTYRKAIESVLSQKTNFDYVIWAIDDASNDGTAEIINEYASKYPSIVIPKINNENMRGEHIKTRMKEVTTKYYAMLECDDYWCDDNKLQMQVDIMENHPECSMCAHNTLRIITDKNIQQEYMHSEEKIYKLPKKKLIHNYIEPHTSSRLMRTSSIDWEEVADSFIPVYDATSSFYFLTKGDVYYIDKIMSVYNYTGSGAFSSASGYVNRLRAAEGLYFLNRTLKYKYNYLLSDFISSRFNLLPLTKWVLKHTKNTEKLDKMYKKIIERTKKRYFNNSDKKPWFYLSIPISKRKRICIEISREKDIC